MKTLTKFRYPLQIHLLTLFILLVILVGGIVGGFSYTSLRDLIEARARATSKLVTNNLDANLKSLIIWTNSLISSVTFEKPNNSR